MLFVRDAKRNAKMDLTPVNLYITIGQGMTLTDYTRDCIVMIVLARINIRIGRTDTLTRLMRVNVWKRRTINMGLKKLTKSLLRMADVKAGDYVLLAVDDEDRLWEVYNGYNALSPDKRLRVINPIKPYNRNAGENCWIHRVKKPITRGFHQVIGIRDGIQVKTIQKHHPRSSSGDVGSTFTVFLYNIIDIAKSRDEMIEKRNQLK